MSGKRAYSSYVVRLPILISCFAQLLLLESPSAAANPTKQECVAANEEGQDLRRAGNVREALARFEACAVRACPAAVREDCARRREYALSVPTVRFIAKDRRGTVLPGVKITMDGGPLGPRQDGDVITAEPGQHVFAFAADGYVAITQTFEFREGEKDRLEVVVLERSTPTDRPPSAETASPEPTLVAGISQRTISYVVGAVGMIGLGVGVGLGFHAKSKYADGESFCATNSAGIPDHASCGAAGAADSDSAHSEARVATVVFVGSAALLAGAAVLFFTSPRVTASLTGTGVRLEGRW